MVAVAQVCPTLPTHDVSTRATVARVIHKVATVARSRSPIGPATGRLGVGTNAFAIGTRQGVLWALRSAGCAIDYDGSTNPVVTVTAVAQIAQDVVTCLIATLFRPRAAIVALRIPALLVLRALSVSAYHTERPTGLKQAPQCSA